MKKAETLFRLLHGNQIPMYVVYIHGLTCTIAVRQKQAASFVAQLFPHPPFCQSEVFRWPRTDHAWFEGLRVSAETAAQCLYLCDFYFANTIPFLEIVSEQDRLAGERKLVDLLVGKYGGKAPHSSLMNSSHMRKREFNECIAGLIDREAISVEASTASNGNVRKAYALSPLIMESWKK